MKIFIIAGETSGDIHGAELVHHIREIAPNAEITGIGGAQMAKAGVTCLFSCEQLAVVGLFEVISHLKPIYEAMRLCKKWLKENMPDLLILIDYPGFNLKMAGFAKKMGIKVFYYISPQVWAWKQSRVKKLRDWVDELAVILPFEEPFLKEHGVNATFVGNPLVDVVFASEKKEAFLQRIGLSPDKNTISILPGSRRSEIKRMLPIFLDTVRILLNDLPELQIILPLAPSIPLAIPLGIINEFMSNKLQKRITIVHNTHETGSASQQTYNAMAASDVLLLASGTATLEAGILGTPMLVAYKISPLTYPLAKLLIKVRYASLVNLIAGREVVPEFLQANARADLLAEKLKTLLKDASERQTMREELLDTAKKLGKSGAALRAAGLAVKLAYGSLAIKI